jgi:hypothetical protein
VREAAVKQPLLRNGIAKKLVSTAKIGSNNGTVFTVLFVLRCYKKENVSESQLS